MKGRQPGRAIDVALPVAWARGFVTLCQRGRGSVCHFVIHAEGYTAIVQLKRCRRLHGSVAEMEMECREPIARLKLVPPGLCRSLELWACSPHGVLRFFRIAGPGLIELKRNGDPMGGNGSTGSGVI
ncbi:MAG: hypothetical protein M0R30_05145 [Methanoregula sp.]|jgi:hypothetical protein|uniref:hypothetical protein n=1 Tax=Methanoregula sp. TaxID=2052170 RepID=UPI0025D0077D|nr:hypothetical protein [Methanoregula sp.]MCK9631009.1 hypothetical protein [Methanoregula sp.]